MEFSRLYTVEDVAKMTGLTTRTIRNYLKDGRLMDWKRMPAARIVRRSAPTLPPTTTLAQP
jgi:predicted transcriptional regulator